MNAAIKVDDLKEFLVRARQLIASAGFTLREELYAGGRSVNNKVLGDS